MKAVCSRLSSAEIASLGIAYQPFVYTDSQSGLYVTEDQTSNIFDDNLDVDDIESLKESFYMVQNETPSPYAKIMKSKTRRNFSSNLSEQRKMNEEKYKKKVSIKTKLT